MNHELYMRRCLQLGETGLGNVAPNPLVGCVIVQDSKIIGEGYHKKYGSHHAEVNAIKYVKNKSLLAKSILYITLEPCSHYGQTPPCTDLIIKYKIPEVIIGNKDPFEGVDGNGIKRLKEAGIKVTAGVLEKECRFMNRRFLVFHEKKRPFVILKWAESMDGFIAPPEMTSGKKNYRISNEYSHLLVHKWRSEEPAIMVGTNTARNDNPNLNVREWEGKNPIRIVVDKNLRLSATLHLFDQKIRTIVFTSKDKASVKNLEYVKINFQQEPLEQMLGHLYKQNLQSVIIEGGSELLTSFIEKGYWDEARVFKSDKILTSGIKAPHITGKIFSFTKIDTDTLTVYRN